MSADIFVSIFFVIYSTITFVVLSHYRLKKNQEYAEKYKNSKAGLICRLIITILFKYGAVGYFVFMGYAVHKQLVTQNLLFMTVYVYIPFYVSLHYFIFNSLKMNGIINISIGIYNLILILVSILEYMEKVTFIDTNLGLTIAIAIFWGMNALYDGIVQCREIKNN